LAYSYDLYWFYTLTFRTREGVLPWMEDPASRDKRYLGCRVEYLGNGDTDDNPWSYHGSVELSEADLLRLTEAGAGGLAGLPVTVTNRSPHPWQEGKEYPVQLSYHWFHQAGGDRAVWDGLRTPLASVGPRGGELELEMAVRLPDEPGQYLFQPDLIYPGIDWFSSWKGDGFPLHPVTVSAPEPGKVLEWESKSYYQAAITRNEMPAAFIAGAQARIKVHLENRGSSSWSTEGLPSVRLSYHWLHQDGSPLTQDGLHTALPAPLGSGESADIEMEIACPAEAGEYLLELDLLCEGINWFATVNGEPLQRVPVTVSSD